MKRIPLILAALSLVALFPLSAQETKPAEKPESAPQPTELQKLLQEAQKMRVENRFTEALAKLDEAEKLAPDMPVIYTMRGDVYMAPRRRDVAMAREMHQKALSLEPQSPGPYFNLAEIAFSEFEFKESEAAFRKLLADFPKLPMHVRHIVWNRIVICQARQGHVAEAEKIIKEQFTFMDDTPAYQFSNAAIAFVKNDEPMAKEWILRATSIFKEQFTGPYFDALKEMRWIKDVDFDALPLPAAAKKL